MLLNSDDEWWDGLEKEGQEGLQEGKWEKLLRGVWKDKEEEKGEEMDEDREYTCTFQNTQAEELFVSYDVSALISLFCLHKQTW